MDHRRLKKIFTFSLFIASVSFLSICFADELPKPAEMGLPFEKKGEATQPVVTIIKEAIKYVGLLAILAISWGGIQFLVSYGNDEKVKKAKQTIIYALVGVILSISAYAIVDLVNSINVLPR